VQTLSRFRQAVESSLIAALSYEQETGRLVVEFHGGATYVYWPVTHDVVRALMDSESMGRFFNRAIRGRFEYCRVDGGTRVLRGRPS